MRPTTRLGCGLLLTSVLAVVGGCSRSPGVADPRSVPLEGTRWLLAEVGGQHTAPEPGGEVVTLRFDRSLVRASGFAGVNRYSGSYTLEGGSLRLGPLATTRMAGTPDADALERAVLAGLAGTTAWRVTGGSLSLMDATGATLLRFDAAPDER